MKDRELFSNLITLPPIFVRLDGRSFHRVADQWNLEAPFDARFSDAMAAVCTRLITTSGLSPDFAFTFSDEISLYFSLLPFNGRVEKIDSVAASYAASSLTLEIGSKIPVSFDARIIHITPELAVQYLINRQGEAWRNHLNAYCQNALVMEGMSRSEAARSLHRIPSRELHELMYRRGINLAKTPAWQRRGVLVFKTGRNIMGYNPVEGKMVETVRSAVTTDRDLPVFSTPEGRSFLLKLLGGL